MRGMVKFAAFVGLAAARAPEGSVYDDSPLVVVYYENWAGWVRDFSPSHVEKNILSRDMPVRNWVINYAFLTWNVGECSLISVDSIDLQKGDKGGWTKDDWNIDATEDWETKKPMGGHLPAFMALKSNYPHIKLLPSVGGWSRSHTFHDCLTNKLDHMVQSVADHVVAWGWDGLDLDWEYPACDLAPCGCQNEAVCTAASGFSNKAGAGDYDLYKKFVKKVRQSFDSLEEQLGRRLYITAAVGMNPKIIDGGNDTWSEGAPYEWMCNEDDFDWINLMTYDFYGPWTARTGPLAPLHPNPSIKETQMSIEDSIQRILKTCSKPYKLTMGLATYGKSWQDVPAEGAVPGLWENSTSSSFAAGGTWEAGTLSYFDIKKNVLPSCKRTWDEASKTPTLFCHTLPNHPDVPHEAGRPVARGQKNVFITYEDGDSWKAKMAYAREQGMAGAIIWAASDTGNGKAYAPDSTNDLFKGLFEGWTREAVTLPEITSLAPSPGDMTRWEVYPCPLVTGPSKGQAPVDVSRCEGKSYPTGKVYMKVPTGTKVSDVGKDKVLIHPIGATEPTESPTSTVLTGSVRPVVPTLTVVSTSTEASAASTDPTTPISETVSPTVTVPSTTTIISTDSTTPKRVTALPVIPTLIVESTTNASSNTSTEPPTPKSETAPATVPDTSIAPSPPTTTVNSAIADCERMISSQPHWIDYCKSMCSLYFGSKWCPDANDGASLAQCVHGQYIYCTIESTVRPISPTPAPQVDSTLTSVDVRTIRPTIPGWTWMPPGTFVPPTPLPTGTTDSTTKTKSPAVIDCEQMISSQPQWVDYCKSMCSHYSGSKWCPVANDGASLADCVHSQDPYCTVQNSDPQEDSTLTTIAAQKIRPTTQGPTWMPPGTFYTPTTLPTGTTNSTTKTKSPAVIDCERIISSQPQWVDYCKSMCSNYFGSKWCPDASDGLSLAECVHGKDPYCTVG